MTQRFDALKETAQLLSDEVESFNELSERILSQVVLETIRTYQQKLSVGIEDSAADLLDAFKQRAAQKIIDAGSGWRSVNQDYCILPRGCRFCFTHSNNTIVVIEQDPQTRTLTFSGGMQGTYSESGATYGTERVNLAFPYQIFVFKFVDFRFSEVFNFCRTAPIRTRYDMLLESVLPNIHIGGGVCMPMPVRQNPLSISETCDEVIAEFWSSQFNYDLSTKWWDKGHVSEKIRTGSEWAKNTELDPLFILGVGFKEFKNLNDFVYQLGWSTDPSEANLRSKISEEIDACVGGLFHKITAYMKKTKFERHAPKDINEILRKHLKACIGEFSEVLMVLNNEVDKFIQEKSPVKTVRSAGMCWSEE